MQIYLVFVRDYMHCDNEDCYTGYYAKYFRGAFATREEAQAFIDSHKYYQYKYKGEIRRKLLNTFSDYDWEIKEEEMTL